MKKILFTLMLLVQTMIYSQDKIVIDGNFDDWNNIPMAVKDSANNVHDTDGYSIGGQPSSSLEYSDVDLLEVKFANDDFNLYGYMKASGIIGNTSADSLGHGKKGRYYFIYTIDVDDNDTTGYPLREGGYWPDSKGYDMNMEVEFYNGTYNTGHYLNHEFTSEADFNANWENDLAQGVVRLGPGTYDYYSQWVMFSDSTYVVVEDKGPVHQGIIEIAISEDGHEAEMKAPFWGFLKTPEGENIIDVNRNIIVSASLEASGELSEEAVNNGHTTGSKSFWGSNTAEPFSYFIKSSTGLSQKKVAIIGGKENIEDHNGDVALRDKLINLGFEVVYYRDTDLDAGTIGEEEFKSNDLIVASESVSANKLRKIVAYGFSVPTINMEPVSVGNSHHRLELISTVATGNGWFPNDDDDAYKIKILDGEHHLAAGLSTGEVIEVVKDSSIIEEDPFANGFIGWMVDEIGVIPIASLNTPGGDTSLVIAGIEIGTANVHGDLFKARYVQFNMNSYTSSSWTSETNSLFEAAIEWVLDTTTDVEEPKKIEIPKDFSLSQNYPNPFNPTTNIGFALSKATDVKITIYNSLGQKINELVNGMMGAGNHIVKMDGSNLTSGIYFYRIETSEFSKTMKMMLVK